MNNSLNSQEFTTIKGINYYIPKNIKTLVCAVGLSVMTAVTQGFAEEKKITTNSGKEQSVESVTINVNEQDSQIKPKDSLDNQAESSKKLIDEFIKTIGSKNTISVTKDELKSFYLTYTRLKSSLGPAFEEYMRKIIYDCYISLLNKGYYIDYTSDLDELTKFLGTLSDKKVSYSSELGKDGNYDQIRNIIVVAEVKGDEIIIKEKTGAFNKIFYKQDVKTNVSINLRDLLNAFNKDNPTSFITLIQDRNTINSQKNDTEQKLRETIIALDVSVHKTNTQAGIIKELGDEIIQITAKANNDLEAEQEKGKQAVIATESSKDKEWGDKMAEQEKQLKAEISNKNQDIGNLELAVGSTKQVGSENESGLVAENTRLATEIIGLKQKLSDTELALTQEKVKNNTQNGPSNTEKKLQEQVTQLQKDKQNSEQQMQLLQNKLIEQKTGHEKELEEQRDRFLRY
ncbi:MAG: hypothetical protein WC850_05255 [Candidatus Gracilibacteria bacterium]